MTNKNNVDTYHEEIFKILSISYGKSDFDAIVNHDIASEITDILVDDLCLNKYKNVSDIISKAYGNEPSTDYAVKAVFFATGNKHEIVA